MPMGYVSNSPLSDSTTYDSRTFATLGVTPGTYEWTWGTGAHVDKMALAVNGWGHILMLSVAAPVPVCSWTPEEFKVESSEHQDNANIHYQPFPESVSEEHEIYTDYDGDHRHHVKHDSYLSAHFSLPVTSDPTTYLSDHRDHS